MDYQGTSALAQDERHIANYALLESAGPTGQYIRE
jgi:hypothetical protein